jgi:hypothetical protein
VEAPPRKHRLSPSRRRALELLARSPDGATKETLVRVHEISRDIIAGLVRTGLATVRHESVRAGGKTIGVKRYCITNAGRMALEGAARLIVHRVERPKQQQPNGTPGQKPPSGIL